MNFLFALGLVLALLQVIVPILAYFLERGTNDERFEGYKHIVPELASMSAGTATAIDRVGPLVQMLNETTHVTDAKAFTVWLDRQPTVAKDRKIGTQGYCMRGPIAFRTAAAVPIASEQLPHSMAADS